LVQNQKACEVPKIMDFRVAICSTILTDLSNSKRHYVEKKATLYYEEMLQKLAHPA
jgi:hypothetical protein